MGWIEDTIKRIEKCSSFEVLRQLQDAIAGRQQALLSAAQARDFRNGIHPGTSTKDVYTPVDGGA